MKLYFIIIIALNVGLLTRSAPNESQYPHSRTMREVLVKPNETCNSSNEGDTNYNVANPKRIWICKKSKWIPFKLLVTLGATKHLSGESCKQIQTHSETSPESGIYWVKEQQVYCEMSLDRGGWMLVWQHSYMENVPLTTNMTFYSNYYRACTQHATSWCNIPNKARFNPTEQMIVAYLNKQVIYAYKGVFNRNIDYDWTGGILLEPTRIIDKCQHNNYRYPQPIKNVLGIGFNKHSSSCYYSGAGGTISGTLTKPNDDRWRYCRDSSRSSREQMTLAIFIR